MGIPSAKQGCPCQRLSQAGSLSPHPKAAPSLTHLRGPCCLLTLPFLAQAGQLPRLLHLLIQHAEQQEHSQALRGETNPHCSPPARLQHQHQDSPWLLQSPAYQLWWPPGLGSPKSPQMQIGANPLSVFSPPYPGLNSSSCSVNR